MNLEFDRIELEKLMRDFYILTGIRIVLFDSDYRELLAYPPSDCTFCKYMKAHPQTRKLCRFSDEQSFEACKAKNSLIIYHCHAGLVEASAPLLYNPTVIGYLMFGQISDDSTEAQLAEAVSSALCGAGMPPTQIDEYIAGIPQKSSDQIAAAAKIMEACTFYVIFKNTISLRRNNFIRNMSAFLTAHLNEDLSVERITHEFGISKSKLYQVCNTYLGCGIAEYVHSLRIEHAKRLLSETTVPITEVAGECGFSDYNYFCRVFKKETGIPAKKYRNLSQ